MACWDWKGYSKCRRRLSAHAAGSRMAVAALFTLAALATPARAQIPTITSINPSTVTAGSPAFVLTVTGTNYIATATVSVNTFALVPSSQTATQLQVTVPANLVTTAGPLPVQVINRSAAGGPQPSNTVTLTVAPPAPPPNSYQRDTGIPGTRGDPGADDAGGRKLQTRSNRGGITTAGKPGRFNGQDSSYRCKRDKCEAGEPWADDGADQREPHGRGGAARSGCAECGWNKHRRSGSGLPREAVRNLCACSQAVQSARRLRS